MIPVMNDDYTAEWKVIDSLENQGLPESALEKVNELYQRAKNDNNPPQVIKTVLHIGKFITQLEEEGLPKAIKRVEEEMTNSTFPAKSVFQAILGNAYASYYQQNRWRLRDRTSTAESTGDFTTWSPNQLINRSRSLILASVQNKQTSKIKTSDFNAILTKGKDSDKLRPTLFDILAHNAIDFFINEENSLTEPVYKFYIDDKKALGTNEDFLAYQPETKDTSSAKLQVIYLLQDLTRNHLEANNVPALVDVSLKRLVFVKNNIVLSDKDEVYKTTLNELAEKYKSNPAAAEIYFMMAQQLNYEGDQYVEGQEDVKQWSKKAARELCVKTIEKYPDSFGAKQCLSLQTQIERKSISQQIELVNQPNKPILSLVSYKNVDQVWFKLIRLTDDLKRTNERINRKEQIENLNKATPIKSWNLKLPNPGDYREHQTEIKIDGLPLGRYVVMMASSPAFSEEGEAVGFMETNVSNLGYWIKNTNNDYPQIMVYNRETGNPIGNVQVELYKREYNRKQRKYFHEKVGTEMTNGDGLAVVKKISGNDNLSIKLISGEDVLDLDDYVYYNNYGDYRRGSYSTTFFLDRAIYRPGQTIFFKGILVYKDEEGMPSIVPNKETTVTFYDVNHQKVASKTLRTNEYGTYDGSFTAPESGLFGQMHIACSVGNNNNTYFAVEEYKRPKFEVSFDPIEKGYRLNDTVSVTGHAKAFAGNNIDGATVSYRVTRQVRYPYLPWYFRRYYPSTGSSMEIKFGTTTTDANGKFTVEFEAVPDRSVDEKTKPEFLYEIAADVIDITGETRSGNQSVRVGTVALDVSMSLPEKISRDSFNSIKINTQTLNGTKTAANGQVEIQEIVAPKTFLIKRFWQKPNQFLLSESEFKQSFPHYAYKNEDEKENWPTAGKPMSFSFDTEKTNEIEINKGKLSVGHYRVKLTTNDRYGTPVELVKYISIFDLDDKVASSGELLFHHLDKNKYEPGETANIYFSTNYPDQKIWFEVEHDRKLILRKWLTVKDLENEKVKIEEKHRGNLFYHYAYARYNRSFQNVKTIAVPWTNKMLEFEYLTFRDKMKPGEKEQWQIKVSGLKKEQVAAEMVATLYDASLDEFAINNFYFDAFPYNYSRSSWNVKGYRANYSQVYSDGWSETTGSGYRNYQQLNLFGFGQRQYRYYSAKRRMKSDEVMMMSAAPEAAPSPEAAADGNYMSREIVEEEANVSAVAGATAGLSSQDEAESDDDKSTPEKLNTDDVKVRTNLNETVFFFPELRTDEEGNVLINFTMNEALTRWKFLGFAHTKDLKTGVTENAVVTQKELMVVPNAPRFMREGDELYFTAKVNNLTEGALDGSAVLELYDALTMKKVDAIFENNDNTKSFAAKAGQSAALSWKLKVPFGKTSVLTHRVIAKAGNFSDGEESTLPILTNRMLVTETKPLPIRGGQTKTFDFKAMKKAGESKSLTHHALTLEFTSNPAWYAVQALPYLMEYPYDCTEQIFNRFYANSLATSVANAHPKVKRVFDQWKGTDAMDSNLRKNEELKTALLEETPWVLSAQSEEEQKRNIGLLFDLNKMSHEQNKAIAQLSERQKSDGSFSWFPGGYANRYITQNIVEGIAHLDRLGVKTMKEDNRLVNITNNAMQYLDEQIVDEYKKLQERVARNKGKMEDDHLSNIALHYLYTRSFFPKMEMNNATKEARDYYLGQAEKYWLSRGIMQQGFIILALDRADRPKVVNQIIASLKERAIKNDEMGMYWKMNSGYYWYQLPIETQALMIEVFAEVAKDEKVVDDLKVWMLKSKQTTHWKTTKATASAVYALLSNGDNWLVEDAPLQITLGKEKVDVDNIKKEAGTGYFKKSWTGDEVRDDMSTIKVSNPNSVVAWGAVYWQYFEDLDKIKTFEETPLQLKKSLFREVNTDRGPELEAVTSDTKLNIGDKLKVRIELRVDRPMEYVHMKDMRASGLEPLNVMSQYKWQGGLGYYESTRDVSTNFFFSWLPKGTHVFEYPVRVFHAGDFSNGITTIQCMYAPEFTSHSEGVRIGVE